MAKKNKKTKVLEIKNGITYLQSDNVEEDTNNPSRKKFSKEAREKLSVARRARIKQPRDGTSKKCQNLHDQIIKDYLMPDTNIKISKKQRNEITKWLKLKHNELNITKEETQDLGILTEYHEQKISFHEIKVASMLFDNDGNCDDGAFEEESDRKMDDNDFKEIIGFDFDEE